MKKNNNWNNDKEQQDDEQQDEEKRLGKQQMRINKMKDKIQEEDQMFQL